MTLFSQREGYKPIKSIVQVDSMDADLRNGLWNALTISYWGKLENKTYLSDDHSINTLFNLLWLNYFKKPLDTLDRNWNITKPEIRKYFFACDWCEVYDFIEFIADASSKTSYSQSTSPDFMKICNEILERELSAWRFVVGKITRITSELEIKEIEDARKATTSLKSVNSHLKTALDLLADRKSPDYRNSIKESISAVEAICKLITDSPKAKLGEALKKIQPKVQLHPALKKAFDSLYGYTSDADGIRHALLDEPNLYFEDAKFMLVSCSAFVNYLISKSERAGMKL